MNEARSLSDLDQTQRDYLNQVGQLAFWDVRPFIEAARILVAADEPMRALGILDALPGYYRDHVPPEVSEMKRKIYALLATPTFYVSNKCDELVREDQAVASIDGLLRGQLIAMDVKAFNDADAAPHIIDLGPGEYWLPIGLNKKGHLFTYQDIGLCAAAREKAALILPEMIFKLPPGPKTPRIFVACELIEHLHHEEDIRAEYERAGGNADIIHISTPLYTFDGRAERLDWERYGDLGHLRTYTPNEFHAKVLGMFPGFTWTFYHSQILHMRGVKV